VSSVDVRTDLLLASLPTAGAALGALADERHHLGFTTWRTACRAAGLRLPSLIDFTLQLLPMALIGLLLGGLLVLLVGLLQRRTQASRCAATHVACALTLPPMLLLCASPLPLPLLLLADVALAALLANLLLRLARTTSRGAAAHP
jgi:hypothetical protein